MPGVATPDGRHWRGAVAASSRHIVIAAATYAFVAGRWLFINILLDTF